MNFSPRPTTSSFCSFSRSPVTRLAVAGAPNRALRPAWEILVRAHDLHQRDLAKGAGRVYLPFALRQKYPKR
jgi:hypothetical protein